ncbi:MAG: hypothetical protein ACPHV3_03565 [Vibrio sp.]
MKRLLTLLSVVSLLTLTACSSHSTATSSLSQDDQQMIRDSEVAQYTHMQNGGDWQVYTGADIVYYPLSQDVVAIESEQYCNETSCTPQMYKRVPKYGFCRVNGDFIRSADLMIEGNTSAKSDAISKVLAAPCQ